MKVISLVPSWTETLIECGVDVVGRTRYCIHPSDKVKNIAIIGGTKDIDWSKVRALKADFLLLDREENPRKIADESFLPVLTTHIRGTDDVAGACLEMARAFESLTLRDLATRWSALKPRGEVATLGDSLPALIRWGRKPATPLTSFTYIIWKNPWMAVSQNTFIGSVFKMLGYGKLMHPFETNYPEIRLEDFNPDKILLLFSSEPYPFLKKIETLKTLPFAWAVVDGERLSWFGLRTLQFLEQELVR